LRQNENELAADLSSSKTMAVFAFDEETGFFHTEGLWVLQGENKTLSCYKLKT